MEETPVKKEIVVKRLSAFKFSVEVNTNSDESASVEAGAAVPRVSVIQRAPPAPNSEQAAATVSTSSAIVHIRHAIMEKIVEMLLWKLLGEERLRSCGYPTTNSCLLLRQVVQFSIPSTRVEFRVRNFDQDSHMHRSWLEGLKFSVCFRKM